MRRALRAAVIVGAVATIVVTGWHLATDAGASLPWWTEAVSLLTSLGAVVLATASAGDHESGSGAA